MRRVLVMLVLGGLLVSCGGRRTVEVSAGFPACQVSLSVAGSTSTAQILSGCSGPGFTYASFRGLHNDNLFDLASGPPWTVNLPCGPWQTDFTFGRATPAKHIYKFLTGNRTCTLLTLRAVVIGGPATAADFDLMADGPVDISGITGAPSITDDSVPAGTFALAEHQLIDPYLVSAWDCTGDASATPSSVTLTAGEDAVCVITFTFQAAPTTTTSTTAPPGVTTSTTVPAVSSTLPAAPVAPPASVVTVPQPVTG